MLHSLAPFALTSVSPTRAPGSALVRYLYPSAADGVQPCSAESGVLRSRTTDGLFEQRPQQPLVKRMQKSATSLLWRHPSPDCEPPSPPPRLPLNRKSLGAYMTDRHRRYTPNAPQIDFRWGGLRITVERVPTWVITAGSTAGAALGAWLVHR